METGVDGVFLKGFRRIVLGVAAVVALSGCGKSGESEMWADRFLGGRQG